MMFTFQGTVVADTRWLTPRTHVLLPTEVKKMILDVVGSATIGWGSVRVRVCVRAKL
jgi:hypothetical protein